MFCWVICTIWIWRYLSHFARNNKAWEVETIHETMPYFHDLLMFIIFIEYEALFTDHINKSPNTVFIVRYWSQVLNIHIQLTLVARESLLSCISSQKIIDRYKGWPSSQNNRLKGCVKSLVLSVVSRSLDMTL